MEENYINIFCTFIGKSMLAKKVGQKDAFFLLADFYKVCDNVNTRADLIAFLNKHTLNKPFLEELKHQLTDKNFVFIKEK